MESDVNGNPLNENLTIIVLHFLVADQEGWSVWKIYNKIKINLNFQRTFEYMFKQNMLTIILIIYITWLSQKILI